MPNANYIKGVRKERQIVNDARDVGLIAFRSAGSHSPIDVCIIDLKGHTITFVQSKPESMSDNKKRALEAQFKELNGKFDCSFKVV